MEKDTQSHTRKTDHIEGALKPSGDSSAHYFDRYIVEHCALPEFDWDDLDTSCEFLGRTVSAPFMIGSLTGGPEQAAQMNRRLASAAQKAGVPLALGSAKIAIRDPASLPSFQVRELCPDVPLLANLGLADLESDFTMEDCRALVKSIEADALIFHINPVHEAMQAEGTRRFTGLIDRLLKAVDSVGVPIVVKEVGHGISRAVFEKLDGCDLYAIDIAGSGGTSWGAIESERTTDPARKAACRTFADWGFPTPLILESLAGVPREAKLIASGGIRSGLDLFKSLCLGADFGAAAMPFLKPALIDADAVSVVLDQFILELKLAMFGAGVQNMDEAGAHMLIRNF
jgi:isopentenyl-diphosphate Delta-isomerase